MRELDNQNPAASGGSINANQEMLVKNAWDWWMGTLNGWEIPEALRKAAGPYADKPLFRSDFIHGACDTYHALMRRQPEPIRRKFAESWAQWAGYKTPEEMAGSKNRSATETMRMLMLED